MENLKKEGAIEDLGEAALAQKDLQGLVLYLQAWNAKKLVCIGGIDAYNKLSPTEQSRLYADLMREIIDTLGRKEYEALTEEERRPLTLFIWGGCCMHKDLNSFKGGNTKLMQEHERLGLTPPVILTNRHNAVRLKRWLEPGTKLPDTLTAEEQLAFESSIRGRVCWDANLRCIYTTNPLGQEFDIKIESQKRSSVEFNLPYL
jgi:hypothetical protein